MMSGIGPNSKQNTRPVYSCKEHNQHKYTSLHKLESRTYGSDLKISKLLGHLGIHDFKCIQDPMESATQQIKFPHSNLRALELFSNKLIIEISP